MRVGREPLKLLGLPDLSDHDRIYFIKKLSPVVCRTAASFGPAGRSDASALCRCPSAGYGLTARARCPPSRACARLHDRAVAFAHHRGSPQEARIMPTDPSTPVSDGHALAYCGFRFELRAEPPRGGYQPIVVLVRTPADEEATQLPNYTAEQQAMRWVHDQPGDGQARTLSSARRAARRESCARHA